MLERRERFWLSILLATVIFAANVSVTRAQTPETADQIAAKIDKIDSDIAALMKQRDAAIASGEAENKRTAALIAKRKTPGATAQVDPFTQAIQDAWANEPAADRAKIGALADFCKMMAKPDGALGNKNLTSAKAFKDLSGKVRAPLVTDTQLVGVRGVINAEVEKAFGGEALNDSNKEAARQVYERSASIIEGLK